MISGRAIIASVLREATPRFPQGLYASSPTFSPRVNTELLPENYGSLIGVVLSGDLDRDARHRFRNW